MMSCHSPANKLDKFEYLRSKALHVSTVDSGHGFLSALLFPASFLFLGVNTTVEEQDH
jgi:hypothetical protein